MMTKIEAEKELIAVITDLLNPYNEKKVEVEVEAHLLAEDGWRKVTQAEWVSAPCSEKDGNATCSACGHWDWSDCNYCSCCGAEMVGRR